ncbi:tripartite tricarboxylate transporter TctB family protein [Gemmobacter serpentinus]|uniref:tripartite tricarboxylate transporter TctB family protein n=1 Tax=Gemmobacter serpentinus TaxID=2652247 RepID=UPI00186587C4|nr:tripartite tricarboxylate transporter TctB family protein [Gemmobacter serpentinus]
MSHETSGGPTPPLASSFFLGREQLAGLSLIGFGLFALYASADLPFFTQGGVGSGLMPRSLAVLIVFLGIVQLVLTWRQPAESTGRWPIRDMMPVLIGIFLFAVTIRGFDFGAFRIPVLGMLVATPLSIICSGLAAKDVRPVELTIFAITLTAICIGLFRYALAQPLPVAPWLIGY